MTPAEQRAALIDALAALVLEDRRREAEHNPKKPPYYFINISHPVIRVFYLQWMAKHNEAAPPGDLSRDPVVQLPTGANCPPPDAAAENYQGFVRRRRRRTA